MPAGQEMCSAAQEVALKLLPLHDFVPMDLRQVLVESFLGFIFKNFEKLDFEDTSTLGRTPSENQSKILKFLALTDSHMYIYKPL